MAETFLSGTSQSGPVKPEYIDTAGKQIQDTLTGANAAASAAHLNVEQLVKTIQDYRNQIMGQAGGTAKRMGAYVNPVQAQAAMIALSKAAGNEIAPAIAQAKLQHNVIDQTLNETMKWAGEAQLKAASIQQQTQSSWQEARGGGMSQKQQGSSNVGQGGYIAGGAPESRLGAGSANVQNSTFGARMAGQPAAAATAGRSDWTGQPNPNDILAGNINASMRPGEGQSINQELAKMIMNNRAPSFDWQSALAASFPEIPQEYANLRSTDVNFADFTPQPGGPYPEQNPSFAGSVASSGAGGFRQVGGGGAFDTQATTDRATVGGVKNPYAPVSIAGITPRPSTGQVTVGGMAPQAERPVWTGNVGFLNPNAQSYPFNYESFPSSPDLPRTLDIATGVPTPTEQAPYNPSNYGNLSLAADYTNPQSFAGNTGTPSFNPGLALNTVTKQQPEVDYMADYLPWEAQQ